MSDNNKTETLKKLPKKKEEAQNRLAERLRQNLKRRKKATVKN